MQMKSKESRDSRPRHHLPRDFPRDVAAAYVQNLVFFYVSSQRCLIATNRSIERRFFFSFPCNPHRRCVREISAQKSTTKPTSNSPKIMSVPLQSILH